MTGRLTDCAWPGVGSVEVVGGGYACDLISRDGVSKDVGLAMH